MQPTIQNNFRPCDFKTAESLGLARSVCRFALTLALACLVSCSGIALKGELGARDDRDQISQFLKVGGDKFPTPPLGPNPSISAVLEFAMLNNPEVQAAYFDWASSVDRITVERSLPDPQLMFEADIQRMVMSAMPGLMIDLPGPGKLRAAGKIETAASRMRYYQFEQSVLKTAMSVKKALYDLWLLDEKLVINEETKSLLSDIERLASSQNEVGKASLQDVLRAQIEQDTLRTEIENLRDSRQSLLAQYGAALGILPGASVPGVPVKARVEPENATAGAILEQALLRNPRLKAMEADLRRAEAALSLARRSALPDFSAGIEVDVKGSPVMLRPTAGMSLPIWRDKIAAEIAAAQAEKRASEARLSAEQIMLAADYAAKAFMFREATRTWSVLRASILPKARQALEVARSGYTTGTSSYLDFAEAERSLLEFRLQEAESWYNREIAAAELSLLIAAHAPEGAPFLKEQPVVSASVATP